MKNFFEKYWTWMAGAFGLIVLIRSYKVATNEAFYNATTATSVPFKNAGGAQAAGVTGQTAKNASGGTSTTSALSYLSGSDTQTIATRGVTTTSLKPSTETGINTGSENGSAAANYLNRGMAIQLGQNFYPYSDPVTGNPGTMFVHTLYYLGPDLSNLNGDGLAGSDWFVLFSTDPSSDTGSPLAFGDAGVVYDGNSDASGSSAYWPVAPNGMKGSSIGGGIPAGYSSQFDTGING